MSSKRNVQLVIHAGMAVALGISLIAIDAIAQTQITRPVRLIVSRRIRLCAMFFVHGFSQ